MYKKLIRSKNKMINYRITSVNIREHEINHTYRKRDGTNYKSINGNMSEEEKLFLKQIAENNEQIITKFNLDKLELQTYLGD